MAEVQDWHVFLEGVEASPRAQGGGKREFIVRNVASPLAAERQALETARVAGLEGATVVGCYPWVEGRQRVVHTHLKEKK